MALLTRLLEVHTRHWGWTIADQLIDLVNAGVRVPNGYTLLRPMSKAWMDGNLDSWQIVAEDMAAAESIASTNDAYTISLRDFTSRLQVTGAAEANQYLNKRVINGGGGARLDDSTMITAAQIYSMVLSSGLFSSIPTSDDATLAIGFGEREPSESDPFPQDMYFSVYMLSYHSGLLGYGLVIRPSQADTVNPENLFQVNTLLWGDTWHSEFLALVNEQRSFYGLPPYKLPTQQVYLDRYRDISQEHAYNMVATGRREHNSSFFPEGVRTFSERVVAAGFSSASENLITARMQAVYSLDTPFNPSGVYKPELLDLTYQIVNEATLATPYEAFQGWWNSGGHRQNILRDWGSTEVYSFMGYEIGGEPLDLPGIGNWLWLCNVFANLEAQVAERTLNITSEIVGANILLQNVSYRVDAFVDVRAQHAGQYSIRIAAPHLAEYGARVAVQHQAPIHYGVLAWLEAVYGGTEPVKAGHQSEYQIKDTVTAQGEHRADYGLRVGVAHSAVYDQPIVAQAAHRLLYDDTLKVVQAHLAPYEEILRVQAQHRLPYSDGLTVYGRHTLEYALQHNARAQHQAGYGLLVDVTGDHQSGYDLSALNAVRAQNRALWVLLGGGSQVVQSIAYLTLQSGQVISLSDAVVSQDESGYAWNAQMRIESVGNFRQIVDGDPMTLTIGDEDYALIVTQKRMMRSEVSAPDMRVYATSPSVLLEAPRAGPMSLTIPTPMLARDVVELALGQVVNWQTVNWEIPAYRVQFIDSTPMSIARAIAKAVGAVVQTERDGTITVRSLFPVTLSQVPVAVPAHSFNDVEDLLDTSEAYDFHSGFSRFRIREGESTFGDRLQWVPDEVSNTTGILRVLPSPWRTSFEIECTDDPDTVVIRNEGERYRQETQMVEFKLGQAGVSFPIHTLDSVEWHSESLGSLAFEQYSTSLTGSTLVNEGYGVATIVYTTRCIEFAVESSGVPVAQFVMIEGS